MVPEQEENVKKTEQKIEQEIADDYLIVPLYGTPEIIEEKKNKYIALIILCSHLHLRMQFLKIMKGIMVFSSIQGIA